jgi:hypothetical protein
MASYNPGCSADSVQNRGLRPSASPAREKVTYVVQPYVGDEVEVQGEKYYIDGNHLTVVAAGVEVASFNNWSSIRVKDAA